MTGYSHSKGQSLLPGDEAQLPSAHRAVCRDRGEGTGRADAGGGVSRAGERPVRVRSPALLAPASYGIHRKSGFLLSDRLEAKGSRAGL